jgi:hypothetical protein
MLLHHELFLLIDFILPSITWCDTHPTLPQVLHGGLEMPYKGFNA